VGAPEPAHPVARGGGDLHSRKHGIRLGLTHHLRYNRVLHERVLLIASITTDASRVEPQQRIRLEPVGAGITRVLFHFGFMETPDVMEGLKLACLEPELRGIDPLSTPIFRPRISGFRLPRSWRSVSRLRYSDRTVVGFPERSSSKASTACSVSSSPTIRTVRHSLQLLTVGG
jgi:hypothetical protein